MLHMYNINSKATNKITQQLELNKTTKETKKNHKNNNLRGSRKRRQR